MKSTLLHLRVDGESSAVLDKLAGNLMSRQQVAMIILQAACQAVQRNQGKLKFPPAFAVEDDGMFSATSFRINEPKQTEKRK